MGQGKQARILTDAQVRAALAACDGRRYPLRDRVMVLLSVRAGLRAKEIACLKWGMVTDAEGRVGDALHLDNKSSKGRNGGRTIPLHAELRAALLALHTAAAPSIRGGVKVGIPESRCSTCAGGRSAPTRSNDHHHFFRPWRRTRPSLNAILESVRKDHTGLHSFRSMRQIEARRRNARPLRLRFSQSLASLGTIEPRNCALDDPAFGEDLESFCMIGALDDFSFEVWQDARQTFGHSRPCRSPHASNAAAAHIHQECRHGAL